MVTDWSARWQEDSGAFDEFSELGAETSGGRAVDDVVVDGQREVEDVPGLDVIIDDAGCAVLRQEPPRGKLEHVCVAARAVIGGHEVVADHE